VQKNNSPAESAGLWIVAPQAAELIVHTRPDDALMEIHCGRSEPRDGDVVHAAGAIASRILETGVEIFDFGPSVIQEGVFDAAGGPARRVPPLYGGLGRELDVSEGTADLVQCGLPLHLSLEQNKNIATAKGCESLCGKRRRWRLAHWCNGTVRH